ncbi:sensor histidine kinase [Micromonospora chokoriensis]
MLLSVRRRLGLLTDVAVSCVVAGVATWWWHRFPLGGLLYGVMAGVLLLGRRRRPVAVLASVAVLAAVTAPVRVDGTWLHEGMLLITLALAMYSAVVYASTLKAAFTASAVTLLFAVALLEVREQLEFGWSPPHLADLRHTAAPLLAYAAFVWALALSVRFARQRRVSAHERAISAAREHAHLTRIAVAEERATIARELHDIVAHSLSVIVLQANGAAYAFDHDPGQALTALKTISTTGRDALAEIQQLVQTLRSDGGDLAGQGPAALEEIEAMVDRARGAGLLVDLALDGKPPALPGGVALAVYRIVQESLTNTLKHAGPQPEAVVRLAYRPEAVEIEVRDTGDATPPPRPGGHGLVGMRERVYLYGGEFEAGPHADGGWRVRAKVPLHFDAEGTVAG